MKKTMMVLSLMAFGCTNESASLNALESQGFTEIEFQGPAVFGCSDSDGAATAFTATNPSGHRVSGVACCPLIEHPLAKRCTLRF